MEIGMAFWKINQSLIDGLVSKGYAGLEEIVVETTDSNIPTYSGGTPQNINLSGSYIKESGTKYYMNDAGNGDMIGSTQSGSDWVSSSNVGFNCGWKFPGASAEKVTINQNGFWGIDYLWVFTGDEESQEPSYTTTIIPGVTIIASIPPPPAVEPTNVVLVGGKVVGEVEVDPTANDVKYNDAALPVGSLLRNTITGFKYLKSDTGVRDFVEIPDVVNPDWRLAAGANAAWAILQST
jgi:hypothetical protein